MNNLRMKVSFVALVLALCLGLSSGLSAQDPGPINPAPAQNEKKIGEAFALGGSGPVLLLEDGNLTAGQAHVFVAVDSFGQAGRGVFPASAGFGVDYPVSQPSGGVNPGNVLFQHLDLFSTGGPVTPITPATCTIVMPLQRDEMEPLRKASSIVTCGGCEFDYFHEVLGDVAGLNYWYTSVEVRGCQLGCFYSYSDYDVYEPPNNRGRYQPYSFTVSHATRGPAVYSFDRLSLDQPLHWAQNTFPVLRSGLLSLPSCGNLADAPQTLEGDWTGAVQFPGSPSSYVWSHSRVDEP
jgi:hypothetical protein